MKKKFMQLFTASSLVFSFAVPFQNQTVKANRSKLELVYHDQLDHTHESWVKKALPLGNGEMGAVVFGSVDRDRIQLNEKTMWTGGPSNAQEENTGGNNYASKFHFVQQAREALESGDLDRARTLARSLTGASASDRGYGSFIALADIYLQFSNHNNPSDYTRKLSLDDAIASVDYNSNQTRFKREYFVSHPDDAVVVALTKEGTAKLDVGISLVSSEQYSANPMSDSAQYRSGDALKTANYTYDASTKSILLEGKIKDNDRKYATYLQVKELTGENAQVVVENDQLKIQNADKIVFVVRTKTDFKQEFPTYRKTNYEPKQDVVSSIQKLDKSFEELKAAHLADYQSLFNRVSLNLGTQPENYDTATLLQQYRSGNESRYLEQLLFQFGRYLMIASSRDKENALPANLQGVWTDVNNPAWHSDYHLNVNLQMNYWPVYVTNLSENAKPLINFVDNLRAPGRISAEKFANIRSNPGEENGWVVHTQVTPFGWTTPGWYFDWGWSPAANAWIMQNVYEYYEFTQDKKYLKEKIYPMLKETAKFWDQFLYHDTKNDRYISAPAYSPEHGEITLGNAYDQQLIAQLFKDYMYTTELLNMQDALYESVKAKYPKLNPIVIGDSGQVKEWFYEATYNHLKDGTRIPGTDNAHRHVSQLVGLYPGKLFQEQKDIDAARTSLNLRGDGGTGWSKANKINLWARVEDGDRAQKLLSEQIKNNILNNLWDTHAPFQIDGNFGATSGVAEMLLQSHREYIKPLPALPKKWETGSYTGLVARGNFEFDVAWENNVARQLIVRSKNGGKLKIEYPNIASATVKVNNQVVNAHQVDNDHIVIPTAVNDVVVIEALQSVSDTTLSAVRQNDTTVKVTIAPVESATKYVVIKENTTTKEKKYIETTTPTLEDNETSNEFVYSVIVVKDNIHSKESGKVAVKDFIHLRKIDDRHPIIEYYGGWGDWNENNSPLYKGTEKYVEKANATNGNTYLELPFYGTGITINGIKSNDLTAANVYLDGEFVQKVSFNNNTQIKPAVIFTSQTLPLAMHTLKLVLDDETINRRNVRKISLDSFEIHKPALTGSVSTYYGNLITQPNFETPLVVFENDQLSLEKYQFTITEGRDVASINEKGYLQTNTRSGEVHIQATSLDKPGVTFEGTVNVSIRSASDLLIFDKVQDDRDPAFTKGSRWNHYNENNSSRLMFTETYINPTNVTDETTHFRIPFNANRIRVIGLKNPGVGEGSYYIEGDDTHTGTFNSHSNTALYGEDAVLVDLTFDEASDRVLIIKPKANNKIALDYVETYKTAPGVSVATKYDDQHESVVFGSSWGTWNNQPANNNPRYNNTEAYINPQSTLNDNTKVTIPFTGKGISVYGIKSSGLGSGTYTIYEGEQQVKSGTFSNTITGSSTLYQQHAKLFEALFTESKARTVVIEPTVNSKISLDYFEVYSNGTDQELNATFKEKLQTKLNEVITTTFTQDTVTAFNEAKTALTTATNENVNTALKNAIEKYRTLAPQTYRVTFNVANPIEAKLSTEVTTEGTVVNVKLMLDDNYEQVNVSIPEQTITKNIDGSYSFTMPAKDVEITITAMAHTYPEVEITNAADVYVYYVSDTKEVLAEPIVLSGFGKYNQAVEVEPITIDGYTLKISNKNEVPTYTLTSQVIFFIYSKNEVAPTPQEPTTLTKENVVAETEVALQNATLSVTRLAELPEAITLENNEKFEAYDIHVENTNGATFSVTVQLENTDQITKVLHVDSQSVEQLQFTQSENVINFETNRFSPFVFVSNKPTPQNPGNETPKDETPKEETPKEETPKVETPKVETPKVETPKVETPKVETPKVETPKVETPKVETPKKDTNKAPINTADHSNPFVFFGLACLALAGIFFIHKRKNHNR